ncbi:hypothetical protein FRB95_012557 [Tulasnella sp. JGI-2019a]|nr:hypothetical protein FRB95_012557 [Tulasnella sp. JGI-2019a]
MGELKSSFINVPPPRYGGGGDGGVGTGSPVPHQQGEVTATSPVPNQQCEVYATNRINLCDARHCTSLYVHLTSMASAPVPATQSTVSAIEALGRAACQATRNSQTLYRLVSRARDVCENIHQLVHHVNDATLSEEKRWLALNQYTMALDALDCILGDCAGIPASESLEFGLNFSSWSENRRSLQGHLRSLFCPPFPTVAYSWEKDLSAAFCHDDQNWLREIWDQIHRSISANSALYFISTEKLTQTELEQAPIQDAVGELLALIKDVFWQDYDVNNMEAGVCCAMDGYNMINALASGSKQTDWPMIQLSIGRLRSAIQVNHDVHHHFAKWNECAQMHFAPPSSSSTPPYSVPPISKSFALASTLPLQNTLIPTPPLRRVPNRETETPETEWQDGEKINTPAPAIISSPETPFVARGSVGRLSLPINMPTDNVLPSKPSRDLIQDGRAWSIVHDYCHIHGRSCTKAELIEGPEHKLTWIVSITIDMTATYVGDPAKTRRASLRSAAIKAASALNIELPGGD